MSVTTTALAKEFLEISHASQDNVVGALLNGSEALIEEYCGIKLASASRSEDLHGGVPYLRLRYLPATALSKVTDLWDSEVWDAGLFSDCQVARADADGNIIAPGPDNDPWRQHKDGWWPEGAARWRVAYTGGYSAVPANLTMAILMLTRRAYFARGGENNVASAGLSVSWPALMRGGPIAELLAPFRRIQVASL